MIETYLTSLADWIREAGLPVIEIDGWKTRARSSGGYASGRPWVVMWHHTASKTSADNDVSYIVNADDAPLSNLYLSRDGTVYVIAAGATNTNGKGGPLAVSRGTVPVDSMNTYAVAIEAANDGVGEAWSAVQIDAYFALSLVLTSRLGLRPDDVASHEEWAPTRKIDPATASAVQGAWKPSGINSSGTWNVDDIRSECLARSSPPDPGPTPPPIGDLMWTQLVIVEAGAVFMGYRVGDWLPQIEWVNGDDPAQLRRYENYVAAGMATMSLSYLDLSGITLLGPVPGRDDRFAQNGLSWSRSLFGNVIP